MLRRARGMVPELKQLVSTCEACQELKPRTTKPLLKQHNDGNTPWNKIGFDLFEIKNKTYLVAIDYYSNYIENDLLHKTTSKAVVGILKKNSSLDLVFPEPLLRIMGHNSQPLSFVCLQKSGE